MASIFTRFNDRVADVKRNSFDLSFQNNLTMKFGALYPVFCKEVIPGDTFKITPTFALEFMPMVFPVQTRMRANLHFFYVRNRNLWKDFMDFIGDTKQDLDPPYVDVTNNFDNVCKTCSLGDYLGIPTTLVGAFGTGVPQTFAVGDYYQTKLIDVYYNNGHTFPNQTDKSLQTIDGVAEYLVNTPKAFESNFLNIDIPSANWNCYWTCVTQEYGPLNVADYINGFEFSFNVHWNETGNKIDFSSIRNSFMALIRILGTVGDGHEDLDLYLGLSPEYNKTGVIFRMPSDSDTDYVQYSYSITPVADLVRQLREFNYSHPKVQFSIQTTILMPNFNPVADDPTYPVTSVSNPERIVLGTVSDNDFLPYINGDWSISRYTYASADLTKDKSPYGYNNDQLKISALPFRAYESVYNAFYRDQRNNPFMINGVPEYNKYIPTQDGGFDSTPYTLRYRNWEQDFLTTAVQSPQQGIAPLVGITSLGTMTFADDNGSYQVQAEFGEDGETITSFKVLDKGIPNANIRSLVDMVSSGISINDLRNVNSLQRWLEANMRKGLRYKDQVKAHYNVDIRYDELDMPEFIGGCSEDVRINMVTQTSSDVPDSPLGSYAGQATCVGTSNSKISHYCDEHGFIVGILSVTPVPNYSQLLPKHFIKRNVLDYFFPEFGHIGFQPIRYNEVCPVQAYNDNPASLNDTFGYQRAWYDYLASTDEVHGLFRTELKNYVMNRVFNLKPELSESFLLVDPAQLNEVFASTLDNDDKILGQVYFDVKADRPIPMFGIPRLE
ncbi:major capsid protein [Coprobacter secundus]|uniref:major capsid protein n=1 Tax=Coprobacter secundus TaxID=1501392 RepID=UPI0022DEAF7B|nr:major capsid protein [Coprobacter secundus]